MTTNKTALLQQIDQAVDKQIKSGTPIDLGQKRYIGKTATAAAFEYWKINRIAAELDELRTEAHQRTRRPLSSAHEAP